MPTAPTDPLGDSSGDLALIGGPSALPFFDQVGAGTLTLHLEDGRRWPCVMETADGHALGEGLIYRP